MDIQFDLEKVFQGKHTVLLAIGVEKSAHTFEHFRNDLHGHTVIMCHQDFVGHVKQAMEGLAHAAEIQVIPTSLALMEQIRNHKVILQESLSVGLEDSKARLEASFAAMTAKCDAATQKVNDYHFAPPKEEVRYKQQQDRYRQKFHSKHHRK